MKPSDPHWKVASSSNLGLGPRIDAARTGYLADIVKELKPLAARKGVDLDAFDEHNKLVTYSDEVGTKGLVRFVFLPKGLQVYIRLGNYRDDAIDFTVDVALSPSDAAEVIEQDLLYDVLNEPD